MLRSVIRHLPESCAQSLLPSCATWAHLLSNMLRGRGTEVAVDADEEVNEHLWAHAAGPDVAGLHDPLHAVHHFLCADTHPVTQKASTTMSRGPKVVCCNVV